MKAWPIPGYPDYTASIDGTVARKGRALRGKVTPRGYVVVGLYDASKRRRFHKVQRLILLTFLGEPPEPHYHASHLNGDRGDNRLANLCWETPEANNRRKLAHGTYGRKLASEDVVSMRQAYESGLCVTALASTYQITPGSVRAALTGRTWTHVPGALALRSRP